MSINDLVRLTLDVGVDEVLQQVALPFAVGSEYEVLELASEERTSQKLSI